MRRSATWRRLAVAASLLTLAVGEATATATATATERDSLCAPSLRVKQSADIAAICENGRRWIVAFKGGNIDQLMMLYRPDAQVALHGQAKLVGRDAVRAYFAPTLASHPPVQFLLDVEDIRVYGNVAYLISRYWYASQTSDGRAFQDAGRSLLIYRREAHAASDRPGDWQIQVDIDQASPDVTFPPPPTAH